MNKCEICGANCIDVRCFKHKQHKCVQKQTYKLKRSVKKKEDSSKLHNFFIDLWDERCDSNGNCFCFESGKLMSREVYRENIACYHHLLFKSRFPEFKFNKDNIVIITPDIHTQTHQDIYKTPKIKDETERIRELLLG